MGRIGKSCVRGGEYVAEGRTQSRGHSFSLYVPISASESFHFFLLYFFLSEDELELVCDVFLMQSALSNSTDHS